MSTIGILSILLAIQIALSSGYRIQPKIAGGEVINTNVPYFVSLINTQICSGSLISDSWILTAAHCIDRAEPVDIYFGIHPNRTHESVQRINSDRFSIYPGYFVDYFRYDIALIQLPQPVQFSQHIQSGKLPDSCDELAIPEVMRAYGIGFTRVNSFGSDKLVRHVALTTISPTSNPMIEIHGYLKSPPLSVLFTASADEVYRNVLPGDSGGPLIREKDGVQFGVTKAYYPDEPNAYQAYTRISYFFDWISHVTGLDLPKCQHQAPLNGQVGFCN